MPRHHKYQEEEDDDNGENDYISSYQKPSQRARQQDDDDDNEGQQEQQDKQEEDDDDGQDVNVPQQQDDDVDDDDNDRGARQKGAIQRRAKQQQQEDDDDDNVRSAPQKGTTRKGAKQQKQEDDDDDNDQVPEQQEVEDDDDGFIASPPDDPPPDDDDEDEDGDGGKTGTKSSNININLNIKLADLDNSDLHEGGVMFTKKLLAQLFTGPGEHDPDEEEVPVHGVQHDHVDTADSGDWTVVELQTEGADGETIYMKAKLDSGADDNFMSFDMYEVTGLDFDAYEGPEGPPTFTTGSGAGTSPIGTVKLAYTAGIKPQRFVETFQVLEGLPHDVLIGKPLMTSAHMMMVNPNFANPPEHPGLCLMELPPKDKDSKAKALAFQKQRAAEQAAAYEAKIKAQEAAAPKSSAKKHLFGKH